ncbi:hypothetical protein RRG08_010211 [Elysia crispata]|uniref:Uncharacterized protein n=1 Tax=Elysia crispata TaxID=231223 RepID=A0AAE1AJT4_9GAST|nr:hypothetical protein RRG08_010211 [Elysia crispata]
MRGKAPGYITHPVLSLVGVQPTLLNACTPSGRPALCVPCLCMYVSRPAGRLRGCEGKLKTAAFPQPLRLHVNDSIDYH